MDLFSKLLGAAVTAINTVIKVAEDIAITIDIFRIEFAKLKERYQSVNIKQKKEERFEQIQDINDEIIDLENKQGRDGFLSEHDLERLNLAKDKRNDLRSRINAAKEFELAGNIAEKSELFGLKTVDPSSPNELTRLGGQVIMGKRCSRCCLPMRIQWKTNVHDPTITDLFWSCTGFFSKNKDGIPSCKNTEKFTEQDMQIFGHLARPGLELPVEKLNTIILQPAASNHIKGRLRDAINEVTEDYLCPVHHEKMILKTKSQAADLLDLYYLRCRRCDQTVKIKSATQLDAVLESFNGQGLFSQ